MLVLGVFRASLVLLLLWAVLLLTRLGLVLSLLVLLGWCVAENLLFWLFLWLGDLDDDVSWLTDNFGLETFLGISGVGDGTDEAIAVNNAVRSLDDISVALFLAVLVVGELFVFNVEAELVRWVWLQRQKWIKINYLDTSTPFFVIFTRPEADYATVRPLKTISISCENRVRSAVMRSLGRRECQRRKTRSRNFFFRHTHSIVMNSMQEVTGGCCCANWDLRVKVKVIHCVTRSGRRREYDLLAFGLC